MPTETISCGPVTSLVQNVIYALPPKAARIHALAALEISADGVAFDTLTNSDTIGADVASGFVRCTSADTTVVIKAY